MRQLGLVGYTMQFSATLGEALVRLCRFSRLLSDDARMLVQAGPRRAEIVYATPLELVALQHPVDARVALTLAAARSLTGVDVEPSGGPLAARPAAGSTAL